MTRGRGRPRKGHLEHPSARDSDVLAHCFDSRPRKTFDPSGNINTALLPFGRLPGLVFSLWVRRTWGIGIRNIHRIPPLPKDGWHFRVGDLLSRSPVASSRDQTDREPHTLWRFGLCLCLQAAAAGTAIGPSTKMPRPRKATAINPASTPAGTMRAGPRKLPALAIDPVTVPSLNGAAVSIAGSSKMP